MKPEHIIDKLFHHIQPMLKTLEFPPQQPQFIALLVSLQPE
jgi:hypothetical protein